MQKLKVCELFAGVGGFRLGLEATKAFKVVWSNQWEPSTKTQHASRVYEARFGKKNHSNNNIEEVDTANIPDHDVLVGGFPCQDYSVATSLKNSKGLKGKKGVLWWSIHRILKEKKQRPKYLILENVDRLLKSPSAQRGRDFAIMLKSLDELGYAVEWRVINAAEYGMPQRRKRIFIVGYHSSTRQFKKLSGISGKTIILNDGVLADAFPNSATSKAANSIRLDDTLLNLSTSFNLGGKLSPFQNSGFYANHRVTTMHTSASYDGEHTSIRDVLLEDKEVPPSFFLEQGDLDKWNYLKGSKKEVRTSKTGFQYHYTEGSMIFPDTLDKPSRTIITGEGGKAPSRFKHVINTDQGLRRLTPVELERLNMFPDDHTKLEGISDTKRAFFMGNALVVGVVEKIGASLIKKHASS